MPARLQRCSSAAAWELLSCGKAAGVRDQFAPLTRASAASTPVAIALFLIALTGFLTAGLTVATHPVAAALLTLGAMTLLLQAAEQFASLGMTNKSKEIKGEKKHGG